MLFVSFSLSYKKLTLWFCAHSTVSTKLLAVSMVHLAVLHTVNVADPLGDERVYLYM